MKGLELSAQGPVWRPYWTSTEGGVWCLQRKSAPVNDVLAREEEAKTGRCTLVQLGFFLKMGLLFIALVVLQLHL